MRKSNFPKKLEGSGVYQFDEVTVDILAADVLTIDQIALDNSTITLSGATGANIISIPDNLASAFVIKQGANEYMKLITTNASESITLGKNTSVTGSLESSSTIRGGNGSANSPSHSFANFTDCGIHHYSGGGIAFAVGGVEVGHLAAADAVFALPLTADALTVDQIALDNSTITLTGATGANVISIPDNLADALSIKEGANAYITLDSTNASERILLEKNTTVNGAFFRVDDVLIASPATIDFQGVGNNYITIPDNYQNALRISEGANEYLRFDTTDSSETLVAGKRLGIVDGAVGTPALYFTDDGNTGIYSSATDRVDIACNGVLKFSVSPTLTSTNTTSFQCTASSVSSFYRTSSTSASVNVGFYSDVSATNTQHCWVNNGGNIYNTNGVYGTISDARKKKDITDEKESHLDKVRQIKLKRFHLKMDKDEDELRLGVIAQEMAEIYPELVALDENETLHFNQSLLIYRLLAAVQELSVKVDGL
jgi:hypothetical protein